MKELVVDLETTGLNPLENEIVAIGTLPGAPIAITGKENSEKELLEKFWTAVELGKLDTLVGFNIDFDWTFLKLRSLKYGLKIRYFRKYEGRKDVRLLLNSDRYRKGTTLHDYANFFSLPIDDGIDGSKIPELVEKGEWDTIEKHLISDVRLTQQLWELLKTCGMGDVA